MAFSMFRPATTFTPQGFGSTPAPSFLQPQPQPQQQQQQQQQNMMMMGPAGQNQQQQQQIHLFTTEKTPVTYQTKWADIHPDSQKLLLQIEERILEYRDESQRLDQCVRLYDTSALNEGFELDAARILQEIGVNSTAIDREKVLLQELMNAAKGMLRNAEVAVRSFMMLRPRFIRPAVSSGAPTSTAPSSGAGNLPNSAASQFSTSSTSMMDFYSGLPTKPSPFLQQTVSRFERQLGECRQWIEELERLLLSESDENGSSSSDRRLLQSLPSVISNVHDFFIYVAAQVETFHQRIGSMRAAYLADQRRRGDENDPFLEADRRELAKREAAAKRVHPALHASTFSQNSTQVAGLFTSSAAPASSFSGVSHSTQSTPGAFTTASSGSGFSMFSAPASSSSSSSFLFSTPASSAPSSIFGSSGALQTPTMFGSSQTMPSMFGANTSSSLFPSATAAVSSSSMFSSSAFGTGAGTTSGSSFGAATKTAKPKPRTTRR